ncbi:hypothetical protein [Dulcicalothrix desertica]|nr:hypothetical protein [Dulcicalothrix desertica]
MAGGLHRRLILIVDIIIEREMTVKLPDGFITHLMVRAPGNFLD